jgi:para-nitrobenzyl esterase
VLHRPIVAAFAIGAISVAALVGPALISANYAASSAEAPACGGATTVTTNSGAVCGLVKDDVDEWLGVPYAAPPIGDLRWQPPQPSVGWTAVRSATAFGSSCIQRFTPGAPTDGQSEDCLYVNVWAPSGTRPSSRLPVMVHIHGGGFVVGSGAGDGSLLAKTGNEVVVSLNYRLGIFGFLANSALGANSGDYGLQDQQFALRWVKQNITAFGGDPTNLTIYGESAGGSSVCDQIASPTAKGLFQKAVSVSGEYNARTGAIAGLDPQDCKSALPTIHAATEVGADYAHAAGCAVNTATCLRSLPAATVNQVAGAGYLFGGHGTVSPTLNGKTLVVSLRDALGNGSANRVPVIAGVARDENLVGYANTASQYRQLVQDQYGAKAKQVLARYPLRNYDSPFVAWRTVAADSDTVCSSLETDAELARRMPVYGYETDYGDAQSPPPFLPSGVPNGSYHVAGWFVDASTSAGLDENLRVLQHEEVNNLTAFARTGDPNSEHTIPWPKYNTTANILALAPGGDSQAMSVREIAKAHHCDFWSTV